MQSLCSRLCRKLTALAHRAKVTVSLWPINLRCRAVTKRVSPALLLAPLNRCSRVLRRLTLWGLIGLTQFLSFLTIVLLVLLRLVRLLVARLSFRRARRELSCCRSDRRTVQKESANCPWQRATKKFRVPCRLPRVRWQKRCMQLSIRWQRLVLWAGLRATVPLYILWWGMLPLSRFRWQHLCRALCAR